MHDALLSITTRSDHEFTVVINSTCEVRVVVAQGVVVNDSYYKAIADVAKALVDFANNGLPINERLLVTAHPSAKPHHVEVPVDDFQGK